jgi:molybdenum cofactor cytidylyltransferase
VIATEQFTENPNQNFNDLAKVTEPEVGIVLLAAGASTRMGRPKQSLVIDGETLLHRSARIAAACGPTVVVLGANAERLRSAVDGLNVFVVLNPEWARGIATSIRCGLTELEIRFPALEGVVILLCDQPSVDETLIQTLISHRNKASIVACAYADTLGVPALFTRSLFTELHFLTGDQGAKRVIAAHRSQVEIVPFAAGAFDLDTAADIQHWEQR